MQTTHGRTTSTKAAEEMRRLYGIVQTWSMAQRIWEWVLTPSEQDRLGGDLERAYSPNHRTVELWKFLYGGSTNRAIVDIAKRLDLVSETERDWLLRELGETQVPPPHIRPSWNRDRGELSFAGKVVRRIRSLKRATNVVAILDSFEEHGWPDRIDIPTRLDAHGSRETIRTLNRTTRLIRFRADGAAAGVIWQLAHARATHAPRR